MAASRFKTDFILQTVILSFWIFLLIATKCHAGQIDRIIVQPEARIQGDTILLGDIATLEGDLESIQKLEAIQIGRAPLAGKERRVSREQVVAALRQQGVNTKNIELFCPREIKITGDYYEVSVEELEAITRSFIFSNMPWDKTSVTIEDFSSKPVVLPRGEAIYRVSVQPGEDYLGKFNADIIFKINGSEVQRVRVSAVIRVTMPVAVSAKAIARNAVVSPSDIVMEPKDLTTLPKSIITDLHQVTSKRARISIAAGALLRQEMFEIDTDVHKGDIVTLALNAPLFSITAPGEALEAGNVGDTIPVVNLTSKNKVYGTIKKNKEIVVCY